MSLPVEIVFGIYLGIITGIVPALVSGVLGFVFKYVTGVTIPGLGVVVLALAIAGINGGLLALNDETIRSSERAPAILTAIVVVLMISLYAHAKGDTLGASAPKRLSLQQLRDRTLSTDVVELVGGRGRVTVEVAGEVSDMEGYPPLPAETRRAIVDGDWIFPADLPLAELEDRFAERLRTELDLADVAVRIDERANATVAAAPPTGALSKRVPQGKRAVSVPALVPTGIARGDVVRVIASDLSVDGTVLAARTSGKPEPGAVDRSQATALLGAGRGRVLVLSRGTRREYELTTLLRRTGKRFRKVSVVAGGPLDGHTIGEVGVREAYDVAVLAARHDSWTIAPSGSQPLSAEDQLFVVGSRDALDRFAEVAR
ncbi:potassium channel family protein [Halorubrum sp. SD626R]|uniref:potassium channel family protein n=1 Tax=Halorubrum sp. SD626R TaxID=1419722 RepID=UPI000A52CE4E|nr:TrkA C-terminal domain-containing protein [Halorubrum sp. SD626R]